MCSSVLQAINDAICLTNPIAGFHTRDQLSCISIKTKEKVCMKIDFNSQRICQGRNHGAWDNHGRRDVM